MDTRIAPTLLLIPLLGALPAPGRAQEAPARSTAAAGPEYGAGYPHRLLFGSSYRRVWTTPVQAEVLDLATFGGGLTPTGTGGGKQTLALRFTGGDGRPYTFRALDKDPGETLPEDLRGTAVHDLYRDQISSSFPTGHVTVPVFLEALGILHAEPRLVILPDDPRLGEWRAEFAGQMGMIEEWPNEGPGHTPGFAGATEIVDTDDLQDTLRADPSQRMAVEEYLASRLLDVTIGDWDRHRGQYRWANTGPGSPPAWRPIPEDRDQAYVRFDGVMLTAAREYAPQLVKFGGKFPRTIGATWNGRDLDRAFLAGVPWETWEERVSFVQAALTDARIAEAIHRLPPEHYALEGEALEAALRSRRDRLPGFARSFYEQLAREVEVAGCDTPEEYRFERGDGSVALTVTAEGAGGPRFRRVFHDGETSEVRVFPREGDDRVVIEGAEDSGIRIRVISEAGTDDVQNRSSEGKVTVYDDRAAGAAVVAGAHVDRRPYTPPRTEPGVLPPRDWGTRTQRRGILGGNTDLGLLIGGGVTRSTFGFRKDPYARQIDLAAAWATGQQSGKIQFKLDAYRENSHTHGSLVLFASGIEFARYYGFGNETTAGDDVDFHKVQQIQLLAEPALHARVAHATDLTVALGVNYTDTELDQDRLISAQMPYGSEPFGYLKLRTELAYDSHNREPNAPRGLKLTVGGQYSPAVWDAEPGDFGKVLARAEARVSAGKRLTLVLAGGGEKAFGDFPYQEASYVGGLGSASGFPTRRFAGDASAYGSVLLQLTLTRFFLLLPNQFGLAAFTDTGRVWLDGEESSRWHPGVGGGIWLAPLDKSNAAFFLVSVSSEDTRFYFKLGGY